MAERLMRAAVLKVRSNPPEIVVENVPIPTPGPGEILVRMDSSPINPSDLAFLGGAYPSPKPNPCIPGFEGSGTVVESGGSLYGWSLVGKRVAVTSDQNSFYGCWAEYLVTPAKNCFKIADEVSLEEASCFFVNPLTVVMFLKHIQTGKHQAVIQNAAASALGKMLIKSLQRLNIPIINIVRRAEQVEILRDIGAEHVLDSSQEDFKIRLHELSRQLNATIGFDAIAGDATGVIFNALQPGGTVYVYGGLSEAQSAGLGILDLIAMDKSVKGAWLTPWISKQGMFGAWCAITTVQKYIKSDFRSEIANRFPLEQTMEALAYYKSNMSAGKTLIKAGS
mmetsp:Transcript_1030/g.2513  ORF Transcript_1030/g.2513 Transcript_1030/m.2513 type:complete len:337 (-) Transcript_1030:3623-4633(-)